MSKLSENTKRLYDDLPEIARRLTAGEPLTRIMREYRVGYDTLRTAARTVMTNQQVVDAAVLARKLHVSATCFAKGHVPWSKGKKGLRIPGCEKGWFAKGGIRGQAARKYRPVGTIVARLEGLTRRQRRGGRPPKASNRPRRRYIKVSDIGPPAKRYMAYARWLWQEANGPLPDGLVIVHLDGEFMNDDLANLAPATRAQSMRLMRKLRPEIEVLRHRKCAAAQRKLRGGPRRSARRLGNGIGAWDCCACGATYTQPTAPARCTKCGSGAFERRVAQRRCG